jgi:hypothetical protein
MASPDAHAAGDARHTDDYYLTEAYYNSVEYNGKVIATTKLKLEFEHTIELMEDNDGPFLYIPYLDPELNVNRSHAFIPLSHTSEVKGDVVHYKFRLSCEDYGRFCAITDNNEIDDSQTVVFPHAIVEVHL